MGAEMANGNGNVMCRQQQISFHFTAESIGSAQDSPLHQSKFKLNLLKFKP